MKYLSRATELIQQRKYAQAIAECDRILRWKSDFPEALQARAVSNAHLGHSEPAIRDFTQAIRLRPDFAAALEGRAGLLRAADKLAEALSDYDALIRLKPEDARLFRLRAYLQQDLRHLDKALLDIEAGLRLEPNNADAKQDLARLKDRIAAGPVVKPTLAETPIGTTQQIAGVAAEAPSVAAPAAPKPILAVSGSVPPVSPELVAVTTALPPAATAPEPPAAPLPAILREKWEDALALGKDFEAKGELENALRAYTESLRIKDENPEAHYHLGLIHVEQKHFTLALYEFTLAVRYRRDYADAFRGRGNLKLRLGDSLGWRDDLNILHQLTSVQ